MTESKLVGRITAQIEDKEGHVLQSCTVENTITDAFLKRALYLSLYSNGPGIALRAQSKPTTGQYVGNIDSGSFGIYALNREIDITGTTVTPPYVNPDMQTLAPDVTFYNEAAATAETGVQLIPVDSRCVYDRKSGKNTYTVEYVKNSGVGLVKSICFGRRYNSASNVQGVALGEASYQAVWTTGTVDYLLEHRITGIPTELCPKGNQQETIVWKTVSASSQFSANLVTKQLTTYAVSNLNSNIANANLTGGHVFDNNGVKVALKAVYSAYSQPNFTYTLILYYNTAFTSGTTVSSRSIVITVPEYVALNCSINPVMVSRPDNGTLEIWVTVAQGTFVIPHNEGEPTTETGCFVYKLTVKTPTNPASSEILQEAIGVIPYAIGGYTNNTAPYYVSGFYFADLQNDDEELTDKAEPEGVYYFPYRYYREDEEALYNLNNTDWAMGVIMSEDLTEVKGNYLARTSNAQQFNAPVMTDAGVLYCRVNSTTLYYVTLSGVISGANLPQTLSKKENNILRLIYEYTLI